MYHDDFGRVGSVRPISRSGHRIIPRSPELTCQLSQLTGQAVSDYLTTVVNCLAVCSSLLQSATPKVMSCSASTGIVTLASDFPSNQLQASDLGVQNTFNIPTDISSSTHPPPVYRLYYARRLSSRKCVIKSVFSVYHKDLYRLKVTLSMCY